MPTSYFNQHVVGNCGLLFTNSTQEEVLEWVNFPSIAFSSPFHPDFSKVSRQRITHDQDFQRLAQSRFHPVLLKTLRILSSPGWRSWACLQNYKKVQSIIANRNPYFFEHRGYLFGKRTCGVQRGRGSIAWASEGFGTSCLCLRIWAILTPFPSSTI